ncbi:hypothetical protein [Undibacterium umbellatum]|uniref:hypothetical protein n=1 Tax=Undibacterium umbellatum TaxID=2762300 RepID=UPI003BB78D7E
MHVAREDGEFAIMLVGAELIHTADRHPFNISVVIMSFLVTEFLGDIDPALRILVIYFPVLVASGHVLRQRRGVEVADAGRTLLHHARMLMQQMERMRGDLGDYAKFLKWHVRMLCNTSALPSSLERQRHVMNNR